MPIQSLTSVRVQDPVLTNVIQGYRQAEFIANKFLPNVPVGLRAGRVIQFGKEDFALYNTRRSPGQTIRRSQSQYGNRMFSLYQDSIAEEVPIELFEEALNGAAKINLRNNAPKKALRKVNLRLEKDSADLIQDATQYEVNCTVALSGTSRWDDYVHSNSRRDIRDWKEAVRQQMGVYPNTMGLGPLVFNALVEHPIVTDKYKYTSAQSITTTMIAAAFEFDNVYVGQAVAVDANSPDNALADIWGKNVWMGYVPGLPTDLPVPNQDAGREIPAFGYTYLLNGYPIALPERYDEDNGVYVYTVMAEREPQLVGMGNTGKIGAGFLATTVIN